VLLRYFAVFVVWTVGFGASAQTPRDLLEPSDPARAYWQSTENTIVTNRADLQQVVEFNNEFPPGTVIVVDQPAIYPWQLQSLDPQDDNFVSVITDADVVVRTVKREDIPGLPRVSPLAVMIELVSGTAQKSRLQVNYKNLRMPSIAYDNFQLPILIADTDGLQKVKGNALKIAPKRAAKVSVIAPSLLNVGERFDVRLWVTDAYGNPVEHVTPALEVMIDGVFNRRVPPSDTASVRLKDFFFEELGLHRIDVRSAGGGVTGSSDVLYVKKHVANRIIWGDFHLHDQNSDGGFTRPALESRFGATHDVFSIIGRASNMPRFAEVRRSLEQGGDLITLENTFQMAIASTPTDVRRLRASPFLAVEIAAGLSRYEWFGKQIAEMGHRTTFFGTQTSHYPPHVNGKGKTALLVPTGKNWQDSLEAGNTYVVSEGKPILISSVNDAIPGSRVAFSPSREISGEVYANYGIDEIELFKNGVSIDSKSFASSMDTGRIQVKLTSPNDALPWDIPRNGREWIGYLRLSSGTINGIIADSYNQSDFRRIAANPSDSRRVDFITWTHGGSSSFLLDIEADDEDLSVEVVIMEGFEDMSQIPKYRAPSVTRAVRLPVNFDDLLNGSVFRSYDSNGYSDQIEISLVSAEAPKKAGFRFVDAGNPRAGDYYYVRVQGLQDQMIWSSPVYVGGFDVID
jgi:hypothetical protein